MTVKFKIGLIISLSVYLCSACSYLKPSKPHMEVVNFHTSPTNENIVILLPGLGMAIEDYQKQAVVEKIRACNQNIDIIGADAYVAYYRDKTLDAKLYHDVIKPAQAAGKKKIWLLGTSLGGFGAIIYRTIRPQDLAGIIIMAPYIGEQDDFDTYSALRASNDKNQSIDIDIPEFVDFWDNLAQTAHDPTAVEIILAYGEQDKFATMQTWLAQLLPKEQVVTAAGAHKWKVWNSIWEDTLSKSSMCQH